MENQEYGIGIGTQNESATGEVTWVKLISVEGSRSLKKLQHIFFIFIFSLIQTFKIDEVLSQSVDVDHGGNLIV